MLLGGCSLAQATRPFLLKIQEGEGKVASTCATSAFFFFSAAFYLCRCPLRHTVCPASLTSVLPDSHNSILQVHRVPNSGPSFTAVAPRPRKYFCFPVTFITNVGHHNLALILLHTLLPMPLGFCQLHLILTYRSDLLDERLGPLFEDLELHQWSEGSCDT